MKKNQTVMLALVVTCVLAVLFVVLYLGEDRQGPTLTVDSSKVKAYSKEQGYDTLVKYVKAQDKKDGDVSDTVIVENIYVTTDLKKANVIYAAKDKSGNVSKITYTIDYIASEEEITAKNNIEETISEENTQTTASNMKTKDNLETQTTQKEEVTTTVEVVTVAGGPKIVLSKTEDTITAGTTFNIMKYVSEITDDKDDSDTLARRIIVDGTYNTAKTGSYNIEVYCTDTDKNQSNKVTFTLNVK